ncbi:MAG: plasmid pRiA4b ORF-3 family protein, partial [Bacilli bacterium]
AYAWTDSHLSGFVFTDSEGNRTTLVERYDPLWQTAISSHVHEGTQLTYIYDFGDEWVHHIVEKRLFVDEENNLPYCTHIEGERPPEDIGGIAGYEYYRSVLADPTHPEYKELKAFGERDWGAKLNPVAIQNGVKI